MPRPRDPSKPVKERTRIDSVAEIQRELRRNYRLYINGQITAAVFKSRREGLVAIRSGMPDDEPVKPDFTPPGFTILSVPTDHFLTGEQIAALNRGEPIIDQDACTPLRLESEPTSPALPALEAIKNLETREVEKILDDVVVAFQARMRGRDDPDPAA